jgi:hypothetical protein
MLIRCEAMHSRLQNWHISEDAADADEAPRPRCMESRARSKRWQRKLSGRTRSAGSGRRCSSTG